MTHFKQEFLEAMQAEIKPDFAARHALFFKAIPKGYGEGDVFWGLTVPLQRQIGKMYYKQLSLEDYVTLIKHPVHEIRLTTLMMMVQRFARNKEDQEAIVQLYLENTDYINNWDLVDCSAHYILGPWFMHRPRTKLFELAQSDHLWKQRIAMLTTFHFIKQKDFATALQLAELLLHHKHDLIHKAVGWMLREIGNRDYDTEYRFLCQHYGTMPRTMLRYAIEKFDEPVRQDFLKGKI